MGDPTLTRGTGSTRRTSELLRVIRGMRLLLIPRVVAHGRGLVWWQHRPGHRAHVLVTLHLDHALPWLLGLRDTTLS